MSAKKFQVLLLVAIAFLGGYFFGITKVHLEWTNYKPNITVVNQEPPTTASLVDFSLFWDVWDKLTTNYYDKKAIDPQKLLYGAISGMVASVGDPYTMFLPPTQNSSFQQQMAGQFSGIGAELGMKGKQIIVIAPLSGSPAMKAGLKAGDAILAVNGITTANEDLGKVVTLIRGPQGTKVTLTIQHKGEAKGTDITITRNTITVKSVDGWVKQIKDIDTLGSAIKNSSKKSDYVMYIDLSQFGDNTNGDWTNLVNSLYPQVQSKQVKGMVLDLRNNPGGLLTDAQFISGEFLPEGTTVVIEQATDGSEQKLTVDRQGKLLQIPLVVLINGGSASASEIVSGALRDNQRAKLVGEKSFGKGTVQSAIDLGNGAGLHVTIAKWLTPDGIWVHGKGLTPDVSATLDTKDPSRDAQLEKAIETLYNY
ncbi:MAG TPA: S41 family peptidase [Patescibacteria group bacterium]|nr:S41 family peptidase [Patescibacteria group bacterium]